MVRAFLNEHAPGWQAESRTSEDTVASCEDQIRKVVYHGAPIARLEEFARYLAWLHLENAKDWTEGAAEHRDAAMNGGWWYEWAWDIGTFESRRIIRQLWRRDQRERLASQWGYRQRWARVHTALVTAVAEAES